MPEDDESEDEIPEEWIAMQRRQIAEYLATQGIKHGLIGEVPAWSLYPYVAIWAIESGKAPGWVGWWVICGDCPTDYVTCTGDRTPRSAGEGEVGCVFDEISNLVEPTERPPTEGRAGQTSHGRRGAARWKDGAAAMMRGERLPNWAVGNAENALELAPLLAARAELLAEWGRDDGRGVAIQ
jgi:hypothetical protein